MSFHPAMGWVAPTTEKTAPTSPADVFFVGNERAIMNEKYWSDLAEKGAVLVCAPKRKIAIYPNDGGLITLAIHDDDGFAMTTICPGDEATEACRLILNANKAHEELTKEVNAMDFVLNHKE